MASNILINNCDVTNSNIEWFVYKLLNNLPFSWSNYLKIICWTFVLGSIPMTIIVLLDYNRKLKQHLIYATDIGKQLYPSVLLDADDMISILDNKDEFTVKGDDILYLEAKGNYVSVFEFSDGTITKKVVRTSLSKTQKDNDFSYIIRCHRSYIVNLKKVINVSGNAQGLKLHMAESDFIVPVSRNYIPVVQTFLGKW
jgi:DNA-binding LytR/AlgR family response regulator